MRILAIDYGAVRTGLALSDPTGFLASPLCVLPSRNEEKLLHDIAEQIALHRVDRLVLGDPRRTDGKPGERAELTAAFASKLEEVTGIKPVMFDERFSTTVATRHLHDAGKKAKQQRTCVDAAAAAVILQSYLDSLK